MSDETLDKLGTYFIYFDIQNRYKITFKNFVKKYQKGTWEPWLAD